MDLDADVTEKAGYGLYCYFAAAATTIMAVLVMVLGYGLYCCCAAVATTTIS